MLIYMNDNYYQKYLKYKQKYLILKEKIEQKGGVGQEIINKFILKIDINKIEVDDFNEEISNMIYDNKNIIYFILNNYLKNRKNEDKYIKIIEEIMKNYIVINSKYIYDNLKQLLFNRYLINFRPFIMLKEIFYLQLIDINKYDIDELEIQQSEQPSQPQPPIPSQPQPPIPRRLPVENYDPTSRYISREEYNRIHGYESLSRRTDILRTGIDRINNFSLETLPEGISFPNTLRRTVIRNFRRNRNTLRLSNSLRIFIRDLFLVRNTARLLEMWNGLTENNKTLVLYFSPNLFRRLSPLVNREELQRLLTNVNILHRIYGSDAHIDIIEGVSIVGGATEDIFNLYDYLNTNILTENKLKYDSIIKYLPDANIHILTELKLEDKRQLKPTFDNKTLDEKKIILKPLFINYLNEFKFIFDAGTPDIVNYTHQGNEQLFNLYNEILVLISSIVNYFGITEGINELFEKIEDDSNFTYDSRNISWIYALPSTLLPETLPVSQRFISGDYQPENIQKINDGTNTLLYNLLIFDTNIFMEKMLDTPIDNKYKKYYNAFGHLPIVVAILQYMRNKYNLLSEEWEQIPDSKEKIDKLLNYLLPEDIELLRKKDINGIPNYFYIILFYYKLFGEGINLQNLQNLVNLQNLPRFNVNTIRGEIINTTYPNANNIDDFIYKIIGIDNTNIDNGRIDKNIYYYEKRYERNYPIILQLLFRQDLKTFIERGLGEHVVGITYYNEDGIDAGGLTKDFYTTMGKEISANILINNLINLSEINSSGNMDYYNKKNEVDDLQKKINNISDINDIIEILPVLKKYGRLVVFLELLISNPELINEIKKDYNKLTNEIIDINKVKNINLYDEKIGDNDNEMRIDLVKTKIYDNTKMMFEYNIYPENVIKNIVEMSIKYKTNYLYIPINPSMFQYWDITGTNSIDNFTRNIYNIIQIKDKNMCISKLSNIDNKYFNTINKYIDDIVKIISTYNEENKVEVDKTLNKLYNKILKLYIIGMEYTYLYNILFSISNNVNRNDFRRYILTIEYNPEEVVNKIRFTRREKELIEGFKRLIKEMITYSEDDKSGKDRYLKICNAWFGSNSFPDNATVEIYTTSQNLPKSHTCFNSLDLPNYYRLPNLSLDEKYELLKRKFEIFIDYAQGFGDA